MPNSEEQLALERQELALQASNEGIWDWNLLDNSIYYSDRIYEFLLYCSGEAPNFFTNISEGVHEEEQEMFRERLAQYLSEPSSKPLAIEARLKRKDGTWSWMRIRGVAVRNDQQQCIRLAGSMIDITKRKTFEAALEEERHLFRMLIENIPENIYFKDLESRFVMANSATTKKLGVSSLEELLGKSDNDFFSEKHSSKSLEDEKKIIDTGVAIVSALERESWSEKDDTWVVTTKFPWYDRKGKIKGTFGITSDVTKLVKTQQKLRKTAASLEKRNAAYEKEIQLAREIQLALVPEKFPQLSHEHAAGTLTLKFSHLYRASKDLSGDYLDVFSDSPSTATVLLSDVMGHGVRSALIASVLRGLIEDQQHLLNDPASLLKALNLSLLRILETAEVTMFATLFIAHFDLRKKQLLCASAGHTPPIFIQQGKIERIDVKPGPALGLLESARYDCCVMPLDSAADLLLYTDGLSEASSPEGVEWGMDALERAALQWRPTNELTLPEYLVSEASKHRARRNFGDDVCVLHAQLDWVES